MTTRRAWLDLLEEGIVLAGATAATVLDEKIREKAPRAHEAVKRTREVYRRLEKERDDER